MEGTLPNDHAGEVILFNFPESVFGRRIVRYLNLRGLPFSQIRVPPNMPRPILHDMLGVNYRRIPVMSIGRDIYIDTRLMLSKLETFFPDGKLGAQSQFLAGIEDMLEEFVVDGGPFWKTSGCIPSSAPLLQNEVWVKDRFDGSGGMFTREALVENRAWSISQVRLHFAMLEKMLADGRTWITGSEKPGMAEIHAGWVIDWALNMSADLEASPEDDVADMRQALSESEFPSVHAWVRRFRDAASEADQANTAGGEIDEGEKMESDVMGRILSAGYTESDPPFDDQDVTGLKKGEQVTVAPTDFGFTHKDEGSLVGLSRNEVVIEVDVPKGRGKLRLHYPRINFKILPIA